MSVPFIVSYAIFISFYAYRELKMRIGKSAQSMVGGRFDKGSSVLGAFFILSCFIAPLFFLYINVGNGVFSVIVQWIGVAILVIGIGINLLSVKTLGKFYARTLLIQDSHRIVQEGPYKFIRHPGYLGAVLVGFGFGLASGNMYILLLIVLVMSTFYSYRIYWEEKMLVQEMGSQYSDYMQRSWRLLPFIY